MVFLVLTLFVSIGPYVPDFEMATAEIRREFPRRPKPALRIECKTQSDRGSVWVTETVVTVLAHVAANSGCHGETS
jgi:hypothetical protein